MGTQEGVCRGSGIGEDGPDPVEGEDRLRGEERGKRKSRSRVGLRARWSGDRCCQGKLEEKEEVDKERGAGVEGGERAETGRLRVETEEKKRRLWEGERRGGP